MKEDFLKKLDTFIDDYSDKREVRKGILSLINDKNFQRIHPEAINSKNKILKDIDRTYEETLNELNELKMCSILYKMANEIISEKSQKVIEFKNLLEKYNDLIPSNLREKMELLEREMSDNIVKIYGYLQESFSSHNLNNLKTAVVSVLTLDSENELEKDAMIFVLKDVNKDKLDFNKINNFFEEHKILTKIDKYIEELRGFERVKDIDKNRNIGSEIGF